MRRVLLAIVPCLALWSGAYAEPTEQRCGMCGELRPVVFKQVPKTIMVPEWTTEKRTTKVVEMQTQQRRLTFKNYREVPAVTRIPFTYELPTTEKRTKEITYTVPVAISRNVEHEYTVMVPKTVKKQGMRKVPKIVPDVKETVKTHDRGHGHGRLGHVSKDCPSKQGTCGGEINYRVEYCDEPYEYEATIAVPEKRTATVQVTDYRMEERKRAFTYTAVVLKKENGFALVRETKTEAYDDVFTYNVQVPVSVDRVVDVPVTKLVPRTIMVDIAICPRCDAAPKTTQAKAK